MTKKSPPNLGKPQFPGMNPPPGPPTPVVPPTVNPEDYVHPGMSPPHGTPGKISNVNVERPGGGKGTGGSALTG